MERLSWGVRRLGLRAVPLALVALVGALFFASSAFAGQITITCSSATFHYDQFQPGQTATETVTANGTQVAQQTASFNSSTGTDTVDYSLAPGNYTIVASAGANGETWFSESSQLSCGGTTQTIAGHIYDCTSGTPTSNEVPGGTLAVTGDETIPQQPNPMNPTASVSGFPYMLATAPSGYAFVSCGGNANITDAGHAAQSVYVPAGGAGVGIFYVTKIGSMCQLTNGSNFNGTKIPGGDDIWFNSVFKPQGVPSSGGTFTLSNASVTFASGGTNYTVPIPNSQITFSPSASKATLTYGSGGWTEVVPVGFSDNVFLSGTAYAVPAAGLPGGINPVTWQGTFTTPSGAHFQWQWAAAVYTQFATDLGQAGVKPLHSSNLDAYPSGDQAGTPENERAYVIGGARGGGGSNFTGSYSSTGSGCS